MGFLFTQTSEIGVEYETFALRGKEIRTLTSTTPPIGAECSPNLCWQGHLVSLTAGWPIHLKFSPGVLFIDKQVAGLQGDLKFYFTPQLFGAPDDFLFGFLQPYAAIGGTGGYLNGTFAYGGLAKAGVNFKFSQVMLTTGIGYRFLQDINSSVTVSSYTFGGGVSYVWK